MINTKKIKNERIETKKRILEKKEITIATPVNPITAVTIETNKNKIAHKNINKIP